MERNQRSIIKLSLRYSHHVPEKLHMLHNFDRPPQVQALSSLPRDLDLLKSSREIRTILKDARFSLFKGVVVESVQLRVYQVRGARDLVMLLKFLKALI